MDTLIKNVGNALLGAALSFIAAYLFVAGLVLKNQIADPRGPRFNLSDILVAPAFVLFLTFWSVIPIGLIFGLVIPFLAKRKARREIPVLAILLGAVSGLLFAWVGAYQGAEDGSVSLVGVRDTAKWWPLFWNGFTSLAPLSIVYCSVWTGGFAFYKAGRARKSERDGEEEGPTTPVAA